MLRGCSFVIAPLYFMCSYLKIEFSDFQRKMIPLSLFAFVFMLAFGMFLGIYTPA
jgi:Mg2+/citrate symporter